MNDDWLLPATSAELFLVLLIGVTALGWRQITEREAEVRSVSASVIDFQHQLQLREEEFARSLANATTQLDVSRRQYDQLKMATKKSEENLLAEQQQLRTEVLGLCGRFGDVAYLLDASESMLENNRWDSSVRTIETWIALMPAKHLLIIFFNSNIETIPSDGKMGSATDSQLRGQVHHRLKSLRPRFRTDTLAALRCAYAAHPDTIVLFTDGRPGGSDDPAENAAMEQAVKELVMAHRDTPINVVAVGTYFYPETSKFLLWMANTTGGSFLGR